VSHFQLLTGQDNDSWANILVMHEEIERWLRQFGLDQLLHFHTAQVLASLPESVRDDLMRDPHFILSDYEPRHGQSFHVPVSIPRKGLASRSVVLKRTLRSRQPDFVNYVIAHELAHAHLRNAGRWPGDDPEQAADALAETWGFPRPRRG
jgi:hypothetical protein